MSAPLRTESYGSHVMNTIGATTSGDSPSGGGSDDVVRELTQQHQDMADAMQRLIRFQHQTLALKHAQNIDSALDTMESLLIEVIDFTYASLQYRAGEGDFFPMRHICPDGIALDFSLMEWVTGTQEVSVLPIDLPVDDGGKLRSLLFLPFGAHHIMLLWLEQGTDAFTREQEALLSVLAREMASVLDLHHFRMRLEKARAATSDIIESIPLGILAVDHHEKVSMINSTAEIALDVRRQDAVGAGYRETLPEKVAELIAAFDVLRLEAVGTNYRHALPHGLAELIAKLENSGSPEETELSLDLPGKKALYLGVTMTPMRSVEGGAGKSGQVVVCRDLQLSHEVKKLRELDAMKSDFLSLVTHELRTPLTSIMAYSETLMMDASESVPKEWREYIGTIHSEGRRLCRLIDDVLDLTRMGAGKMVYTFEQQDPNELIGSVVMSLTPQLEEKGLDLELDLAEDIGECRLAVDRFSQVLLTVVSNAVKYTEQGGKIVIASRRAASLPETEVPSLLITVEDNGVGIAQENLEKVFSKFEIGEAVKNHTSGTGLGLAIGKQIIEDGHNGRIWLASEPGKGTKVFIQVPMNP